MSRLDKVRERFKACRGTFPWAEFLGLMSSLGYVEVKLSGRTGGSRMRFAHAETKHIVTLHKPHDGEMKKGMVERLKTDLADGGSL